MDDWGPDRTYIRFDQRGIRLMPACGNCGAFVPRTAERCTYSPGACGVTFTQATTPFDAEREEVERLRPDLTYVSLRWE